MKRAMLCICPPYPTITPPAGAAALLGYLKAHGIHDFGFLDLRLGTPGCYEPTYAATGVFGESFVMDVPDLPLVLQLLAATDERRPFTLEFDVSLHRYCLERGISPTYLGSYVAGLDRYYAQVFATSDPLDFVGFSVWTSNLFSTLLAAHHLKRRRLPPFIVAGGPQLTESPASAALGLRSGLLDAVATGEGEETLRALYAAFRDNQRRPVTGVPGTLYHDPSGDTVISAPRPLLKIDKLPLPSFDEMAIDAYQIDDDRTLPYQLSRGCTDKCTFCSEWVFWERYRLSGTGAAADGVRELRARYGATYIAFTDSLLNGSTNRLLAFAEALLQQGTAMSWGGFMRAQTDEPTARLLYRAGCREVFVGIESFDDETLAAMNKRRTEAENLAALRAFLRAGMFVVAGLIPGFPGDSRRGYLYSAEQMRTLQAEFPGQLRVNTEPFRVSPGQPLYRRLQEVGLTPRPWSDDYLDMAPRYRDITAGIHCYVEGANQGLERIGRERIAFMITTDAPVRTDKFDYEEDEDVSVHQFTSRHLFGGWHLALIKSHAAVVYALIVTADELEKLDEVASRARHGGFIYAELAAALDVVATKHLRAPNLGAPPLPHPEFHSTLLADDAVAISPFVAVRQMDWRANGQLLVANYVNGRWSRRPAADRPIFAALAHGVVPMREVIRRVGDHGRAAGRCRRALRDLHAAGALVVHGRRAPATDASLAQHIIPLSSISLSPLGAPATRPSS